MSDVCDNCDGRGWWRGGCDGDVDCFACHGTGVARTQGNCEACRGWGWSITAEPCATCGASGSVDAPVALYWCAACMRTLAAPTPVCPADPAHSLELRTGSRSAL